MSGTDTAQHGLSAHSHGAGVPLQIRNARKRSGSSSEFEAYSQRDEQWRYLQPDRIAALLEDRYDEFAGDLALHAPEQITTAWIKADHALFGSAGLPEDRLSAVAWESAEAAYLINIDAELEANAPAHLNIVGDDNSASALHVVINAMHHSRSTVVLDHRGDARMVENVEILVGDEAELTVVSIQDWSDDAVHLSAQYAKLGRNAKLKHVVVSLGGKTVRVTPSVVFAGEGSEVELLGMYFADAGQYLEHRPFVDHAVANCKSRVTYKGALQGERAHTVWVGDVLIRKEADGTDTYELNRNLLLTDGARADSVPNLEIETGQIAGAGHASASGRFDDEQLFYLQARGITEAQARRLVVFGFLNEIVQQIGVESLEERLVAAIEAELARSVS
ncbi:MAG: Fe-S cluster assembly protein SufD [Microbacteriaceae bacterium]